MRAPDRDAEAPSLPDDGSWSQDFREFIGLCLEKDPTRRADCVALTQTAFIQQAAASLKSGIADRWEETFRR